MKTIGLARKFLHPREPVVVVLANQFNSALAVAISFLIFPRAFGVTGVFRRSVGTKLKFSAAKNFFDRPACWGIALRAIGNLYVQLCHIYLSCLRLAASSAAWDVHALNYPVSVFSRQLDIDPCACNRGQFYIVQAFCQIFALEKESGIDVADGPSREPRGITGLLTLNYL
jgi:hypothetical protein